MAAPTRAADMTPAPSYYPAAPLPPARYNWTGLYGGGNIGAGLLSDNVSQTGGNPTVTLAGPIQVGPVGLVGGAQVGFNYQIASWVFGAEASWNSSAVTGNGMTSTVVPANEQERANSETGWFASATGRVGYADSALLLYVKGGAAELHVTYTQDVLNGGIVASTQVIGDNRTGFTAGVGLEYGMTENLSALFEYDFYDFGSKTYNFTQTPVSIRSNLNTLTVGLNYRFNWAQ